VPLNWSDYQHDWTARLAALGSAHPGLVNAALADGSVRTLPTSLPHAILKSLCTRAGGESIGEY
jgi:prepilin-type processing-associated H-X9-DG protein